MVEGLAHGLGRDFVELDAVDRNLGVLDDFGHVPGDGLALPVRVGGQIDAAGLAGGLFQFGHDLLLALDDLIVGGEAVFFVHAEGLGGQVADMAHGGLNGKGFAEKFFDGLHLGGRLDDDQLFCHGRRAIAIRLPHGKGRGAGNSGGPGPKKRDFRSVQKPFMLAAKHSFSTISDHNGSENLRRRRGRRSRRNLPAAPPEASPL